MLALRADLKQIAAIAAATGSRPGVDVMLCPPATPNCRRPDNYRRTKLPHVDLRPSYGDISAAMLRDTGAVAVITGHSERRPDHGETNEIVAAKVNAARRAGLFAIVCIGESESQRAAGNAYSICGGHIVASVPTGMTEADLAIGYEPPRAIGSGHVPSAQEMVQMHAHIRNVSSLISAREAGASAYCTLVPSTPQPPTRFWRCRESMEPSKEARACRPRISWRSYRARLGWRKSERITTERRDIHDIQRQNRGLQATQIWSFAERPDQSERTFNVASRTRVSKIRG